MRPSRLLVFAACVVPMVLAAVACTPVETGSRVNHYLVRCQLGTGLNSVIVTDSAADAWSTSNRTTWIKMNGVQGNASPGTPCIITPLR